MPGNSPESREEEDQERHNQINLWWQGRSRRWRRSSSLPCDTFEADNYFRFLPPSSSFQLRATDFSGWMELLETCEVLLDGTKGPLTILQMESNRSRGGLGVWAVLGLQPKEDSPSSSKWGQSAFLVAVAPLTRFSATHRYFPVIVVVFCSRGLRWFFSNKLETGRRGNK